METAEEPDFTVAEMAEEAVSLYEELRRRFQAEVKPDQGKWDPTSFFTTAEFADAFGVGIDSVRKELRELLFGGRLEVGKKQVRCLGSRGTMKVDAYRIVPLKEE